MNNMDEAVRGHGKLNESRMSKRSKRSIRDLSSSFDSYEDMGAEPVWEERKAMPYDYRQRFAPDADF